MKGRTRSLIHRLVKQTVLHEFYHSVVIKRVLSNTATLSVFKSVFVPLLIYGHESWVMTEGVMSQAQAAKIGFLPTVHGFEIRTTYMKSQFSATMFRTRDQNVPGKTGEASPAGYIHGKAAQKSTKDQVV